MESLICSYIWIFENYSILSKFSNNNKLIQELKYHLKNKLLQIQDYIQNKIIFFPKLDFCENYREIFSKIFSIINNKNENENDFSKIESGKNNKIIHN